MSESMERVVKVYIITAIAVSLFAALVFGAAKFFLMVEAREYQRELDYPIIIETSNCWYRASDYEWSLSGNLKFMSSRGYVLTIPKTSVIAIRE